MRRPVDKRWACADSAPRCGARQPAAGEHHGAAGLHRRRLWGQRGRVGWRASTSRGAGAAMRGRAGGRSAHAHRCMWCCRCRRRRKPGGGRRSRTSDRQGRRGGRSRASLQQCKRGRLQGLRRVALRSVCDCASSRRLPSKQSKAAHLAAGRPRRPLRWQLLLRCQSCGCWARALRASAAPSACLQGCTWLHRGAMQR